MVTAFDEFVRLVGTVLSFAYPILTEAQRYCAPGEKIIVIY
jgi:hypothetical protein